GPVHGDTDTDGELGFFGQTLDTETDVLHRSANALGHVQGLALRRFGKNDDELFATIAGDGIDLAHLSEQLLRYLAQHAIADVVAVGVVQEFEVVEVEHEQSEGEALALAALHFHVELLLEVAAGVQAGKKVGKREVQ